MPATAIRCRRCHRSLMDCTVDREDRLYCPGCGDIRMPDGSGEPPRQGTPATRGSRHELEEQFARAWAEQCAGAPAPVRQYRWHETRGWRLDFAWPDARVCVEVDGACHRIKGRWHQTVERSNALVAAGWRLFTVTGSILRDEVALAALLAAVREAVGPGGV